LSFIAPDLWTDPFGPLLKVAPIMAATAVVMAFQEKRYRIAFFQFIADRGKDRGTIAATLRTVVIADFIFTATAAVAQPITGLFLVRR
jgi:uncharacterized membrane protein